MATKKLYCSSLVRTGNSLSSTFNSKESLKQAYFRRRAGRALFLLLLLAPVSGFMSGCGAVHANSELPAPAATITASPTSISAGGSATLTVSATNATQISLTGSDGSSYTMPATGGTQSVSPTTTTTYTVTASGAGGRTTASVVVTVTATAAPAVTISASPASITTGGSATLTVAATNATQVVVTGTDGSSYTLQPTGGTQAVSPAASATYTATATGAGGTATATATVTVTPVATPAPTVTISANPASITAGSPATLTVAAANATQVVITGSDGSSYTLQPAGGTQSISPAASTTYTATATGPGGTVTATASVTVTAAPAPTVTITASPMSVGTGGSSTLTVAATNATQVTVTGSDGTSYTLQPTGGTQSVTPKASTTYTATATGAGGKATATVTLTVTTAPAPTIAISASPASVSSGTSSTLTVTATNATLVTVAGNDGSSYTLQAAGGTQAVTPAATTIYTATATGAGGNATATATVTVVPAASLQSIKHVIFELQENHSFDNYFGMLNPYRHANNWNVGDDGVDYEVDGIDDKLTSISNDTDEGASYSLFKFKTTCVDDMSSDWLASYGDVNRWDFTTSRAINMDGFVHDAEGYAKSCSAANACSGTFDDLTGKRAMGYYDETLLNYYYYMASQFAVSDRWFSPVSSKSISNRIATFSGGTTQGLVRDPGGDDHLTRQLNIATIFRELDQHQVSWKIYYAVTQGFCQSDDDCPTSATARYPATDFTIFTDSYKYLYENPSHAACTAPTQPSSVVGDASDSFCIDPNHIAPITTYFTDLTNGTLPSFAFLEAGYANYDEHPGSGQSILEGQAHVASFINALMASSSWSSSVFFFSYDEGGGPYDHVPPVPGHSNDKTSAALAKVTPLVDSIAVNADSYAPCLPPGGTPTVNCDLQPGYPGTSTKDAAAVKGFAAQLGFRLPNIVVSPFVKKHYVSHQPMDHTAVIKFVENLFIGSTAHLTNRDAAQPNLLDFFDFNAIPWSTPPSPPAPVTASSLNYDPCTPDSF